MACVKILDCTLRDGSYIVEGNFGGKAISGIIKRLQDAKIDIIECGWLKNPEYKNGSTYYHVPSDIEQYLMAEKNPDITYVAMIDYNRYDILRLPEYDGKSIDAIRVVFPKDKVNEGLALAEPIFNKGYKVFFQASNTSGYTDKEIISLIEKVNIIEPEAISIVDTFGSMYFDELKHIIGLFVHNLKKTIKIGLHSHNNLQLSFANAIEFTNILMNCGRDIIIDSSLCGMGRGAGNACTELVASFLNRKYCRDYDIDIILDTIDIYMSRFMNNYEWGYSIPYYISWTYCAHVNNIAYLLRQHKTRAKDMKNIIERLTYEKRITYDYDNLDRVYLDYQSKEIDDMEIKNKLKEELSGKSITLILPGKSVKEKINLVREHILQEKTVVIGVNSVIRGYSYDYVFFSNTIRYDYAVEQKLVKFPTKLVLTSNILQNQDTNVYIVNYNSLIYRGWKLYEVSVMMLLKLLVQMKPGKISIAGWDGYDSGDINYSDLNMEVNLASGEMESFNKDLKEMIDDFRERLDDSFEIEFITPSRFDKK